jgi:hypothetical protein
MSLHCADNIGLHLVLHALTEEVTIKKTGSASKSILFVFVVILFKVIELHRDGLNLSSQISGHLDIWYLGRGSENNFIEFQSSIIPVMKNDPMPSVRYDGVRHFVFSLVHDLVSASQRVGYILVIDRLQPYQNSERSILF